MRYNTGMHKVIRIGTRGSELALMQAKMVGEAIRQREPGSEIQIVSIRTGGDEHADVPLCEVNRKTERAVKGVFTAEIEEVLARGEVDCAVHSCKDLPGVIDERLQISAILERGALNDTLVIRRGANMDAPNIGTSSVRRAALVRTYWSGRARTVQLRGNVPTRIRKLAAAGDEMDAILLARAGLDRLNALRGIMPPGGGLTAVDLDCDSFMPALCQGAIAVETRRADTGTHGLVRRINHEPSEIGIRVERAFLAALGADCSVPVGGYATLRGQEAELRTVYFLPGDIPLRCIERGPLTTPEEVGYKAAERIRLMMER